MLLAAPTCSPAPSRVKSEADWSCLCLHGSLCPWEAGLKPNFPNLPPSERKQRPQGCESSQAVTFGLTMTIETPDNFTQTSKQQQLQTHWLNDAPFSLRPLQAATAHPRTDAYGVPAGWDHPHSSSYAGSQLPAHQAESVQQPEHHTLQLPQVRTLLGLLSQLIEWQWWTAEECLTHHNYFISHKVSLKLHQSTACLSLWPYWGVCWQFHVKTEEKGWHVVSQGN